VVDKRHDRVDGQGRDHKWDEFPVPDEVERNVSDREDFFVGFYVFVGDEEVYYNFNQKNGFEAFYCEERVVKVWLAIKGMEAKGDEVQVGNQAGHAEDASYDFEHG